MLSQTLFAQMFTMLCEIYDRQPSKPLMDGYYMVLSQMNDEEFKSAILAMMEGRVYSSLPKPAEILEYSKPNLEAIATLAVEDVERAFKKGGRNTSLIFDDKVIHSVINGLGGWVHLCGLEAHEWTFKRKEFIKLYQVHAKREQHPDHVAGLTEQTSGMADGQTANFARVKASYELQNVKPMKALNPVSEKILKLTEGVRV